MSITALNDLEIIEKSLKKNLIKKEEAIFLLGMIERREREKDILEWGKYYFPTKFEKSFCFDLHNYFCAVRKEAFTNTLAPRNHAKTTIQCFLIPLYQALVEPGEFKHYLNVQNTSTKAVNVNLSIRFELENNEKIIRDYGYQVHPTKWTEKQFVLKNGVIFSSIGTGDSVRGINYNNVRPDYIIIDDLYEDDAIENINRIFKIERWFWGSIYPAKANTKKTSIHVQGTAINRNDLMHKLFENPDVISRKFQAIINIDEKKTLWFDFNQLLADKEKMGSIIFEREWQNNCRDDQTAIIKEGWLKFYDSFVGEQITRKIGAFDPAIGKATHNDYSAKVLIYVSKDLNYYIHDVRCAKYSFNENIEEIKSWHALESFDIFKIEEISGFQAFGQELIRTTRIPVKEIKFVKDKITRKQTISHLFENGKVFINKQIGTKHLDNHRNLLNETIYQLINNTPENDDISDAIILGLEEHSKPTANYNWTAICKL